jgi:hypothetical protein
MQGHAVGMSAAAQQEWQHGLQGTLCARMQCFVTLQIIRAASVLTVPLLGCMGSGPLGCLNDCCNSAGRTYCRLILLLLMISRASGFGVFQCLVLPQTGRLSKLGFSVWTLNRSSQS